MAQGSIVLGDSRNMEEVPDESVHLIVTSPPYNVEKPYDNHEDDLPLGDYLGLLQDVWVECHRVLVPGGRLCINAANLFRSPYLPLNALITTQVTRDLSERGCRYLMRGEIIWDKSMSVGASTAWGSFGSPTNPTLRDQHEYILVFSKDRFARERYEGAVADIHPDDFAKWTKSMWKMPTAKAKEAGHPSPFPEELPARLIRLYTFRGECVLDPFVGSGSTCVAARRLGRDWIGYDTSTEYVDRARKRVDATVEDPFDPDALADLRKRRKAERHARTFRDGRKRSKKTPAHLLDQPARDPSDGRRRSPPAEERLAR